MLGAWRKASDTVITETPAACATCLIETGAGKFTLRLNLRRSRNR
jgi:hypothetical protein